MEAVGLELCLNKDVGEMTGSKFSTEHRILQTV